MKERERDRERKRRERAEAERRRRMTPSPTFRDRQRERERRNRDRRDRDRRSDRDRKSEKDRRKSDVFKGSLSEGQTLQELEGGKLVDDVPINLNDIEIPMDSDDEEAKIEELRKRREMRRKMMVNVVEQEESPGSSPHSRVASPLEKVRFLYNCILLSLKKNLDQRATFIKRLRIRKIATCISLQRQERRGRFR